MQYTIKQARKLADLTQIEAADRAGLSRYRYLKIENNPDIATIAEARRLCAAFELPMSNLFFGPKST